MANQYNKKLSDRYNESDLLSNPHQLRAYRTWLKTLGSVEGKKVLDLACGSGFSSRMLAKQGACVVGVDVSKEMLSEAVNIEKDNSFGIVYIQADVANVEQYREDQFDFVTAAFLLHYAPDLKTLDNFAKNIFENLKEWGEFVTINLSPDHPIIENLPDVSHSSKWVGEPWLDGSPLEVTLWSDKNKEICKLDEYYWSRKTIENVFEKNGLIVTDWIEIVDSTSEDNMLVIIKAKKV